MSTDFVKDLIEKIKAYQLFWKTHQEHGNALMMTHYNDLTNKATAELVDAGLSLAEIWELVDGGA